MKLLKTVIVTYLKTVSWNLKTTTSSNVVLCSSHAIAQIKKSSTVCLGPLGMLCKKFVLSWNLIIKQSWYKCVGKIYVTLRKTMGTEMESILYGKKVISFGYLVNINDQGIL